MPAPTESPVSISTIQPQRSPSNTGGPDHVATVSGPGLRGPPHPGTVPTIVRSRGAAIRHVIAIRIPCGSPTIDPTPRLDRSSNEHEPPERDGFGPGYSGMNLYRHPYANFSHVCIKPTRKDTARSETGRSTEVRAARSGSGSDRRPGCPSEIPGVDGLIAGATTGKSSTFTSGKRRYSVEYPINPGYS